MTDPLIPSRVKSRKHVAGPISVWVKLKLNGLLFKYSVSIGTVGTAPFQMIKMSSMYLPYQCNSDTNGFSLLYMYQDITKLVSEGEYFAFVLHIEGFVKFEKVMGHEIICSHENKFFKIL